MIDDTLNIVLDPVFASEGNNRNDNKYKSKFPLRQDMFSVENNQKGKIEKENLINETTKHEGYRDDINLWKHITNLEWSSKEHAVVFLVNLFYLKISA
jgi:hypothetical protein